MIESLRRLSELSDYLRAQNLDEAADQLDEVKLGLVDEGIEMLRLAAGGGR